MSSSNSTVFSFHLALSKHKFTATLLTFASISLTSPSINRLSSHGYTVLCFTPSGIQQLCSASLFTLTNALHLCKMISHHSLTLHILSIPSTHPKLPVNPVKGLFQIYNCRIYFLIASIFQLYGLQVKNLLHTYPPFCKTTLFFTNIVIRNILHL